MYIQREFEKKLLPALSQERPKGFIVSGVVGSGKTTMIENLLKQLKSQFEIFSYNGDDSGFRQKIILDSKFLYDDISSQTNKRVLIFVDEVQKCEEIFDAIKYAFDKGQYSFIISGSNPAYLSTIAKKRLQRRAELIYFLPISLKEIYCHQHKFDINFEFENILWKYHKINQIRIDEVTLSKEFKKVCEEYFVTGGLPLVYLASGLENKLKELRLVVERGFELMSVDNNAVAELTRVEIANLQGQEFTYKNIMEKTRIRKRDSINKVIDEVMNHGYLVKRKPLLIGSQRTSYLSIFSYIDPGIVSYLTGEYGIQDRIGFALEGYIHGRLQGILLNSPYKSELGYYKPYIIESSDKIKYLKGEVDFILNNGSRKIPIECKYSERINSIDTEVIEKFIKENRCSYGVVLYGGIPQLDLEKNIIFWPYWFV